MRSTHSPLVARTRWRSNAPAFGGRIAAPILPLVATLVLSCDGAMASPLMVITNENENDHFKVVLQHGAISSASDNHEFPIMPKWEGSIMLTGHDQDIGQSDTLSVVANIDFHQIAPHNEKPAPGPVYSSGLIDAAAAGPGEHTLTLPTVGFPHETHTDFYRFSVVYFVSASDQRFDITNYTVNFSAEHTPEPQTLAVLIPAMGLRIRRRS